MSTSSTPTLARAAVLAAVLVLPTAIAFAADSAATQQPAAAQLHQQAKMLDTNAASPSTNGNDLSGDDPYTTAFRHEKYDAGRKAPAVLSNEPDWNSPEYVAH